MYYYIISISLSNVAEFPEKVANQKIPVKGWQYSLFPWTPMGNCNPTVILCSEEFITLACSTKLHDKTSILLPQPDSMITWVIVLSNPPLFSRSVPGATTIHSRTLSILLTKWYSVESHRISLAGCFLWMGYANSAPDCADGIFFKTIRRNMFTQNMGCNIRWLCDVSTDRHPTRLTFHSTANKSTFFLKGVFYYFYLYILTSEGKEPRTLIKSRESVSWQPNFNSKITSLIFSKVVYWLWPKLGKIHWALLNRFWEIGGPTNLFNILCVYILYVEYQIEGDLTLIINM